MTASSKRKGTILIVENDDDTRFIYGTILEREGFDVVTAAAGNDGLRLAREQRPRAILMDVSLPGMDGWTVTSHLKNDPETAQIAIVVITAHAFPEDLRRAESVGCDGFLTKPCEPRKVLEEVLRLLGD